MSLSEATKLLVSSVYDYGLPAIESITGANPHFLIVEFGINLPFRKEAAVKAGGENLFSQVKSANKFTTPGKKFVKNLVADNSFPVQLANLSEWLDEIRKYVESSKAEKIVEVDFHMTPPGGRMRWFFFYKLTDNNKWRLEFAFPQIIIHTSSGLWPESFFVPLTGRHSNLYC